MNTEYGTRSEAISRRALLASIGTITAVSSIPRALATEQAQAASRFVIPKDRFDRLFPKLPLFAEPSRSLKDALMELGQPGGIMDAKDDLTAGPVQLIVDPNLSVNNPNNSAHTAGTTFMGQFMDHDLTFDLTSRLGRPAKPRRSPNARTPAFDLDSVYGGGPLSDPELYVPAGRGSRGRPAKLKIEQGGRFEDLPRNPRTSAAIIADPRNDENLMIAGLHAAFLTFHNRVVDLIAGERQSSPDDMFERARQLTTWHYQWMILHEFLPLFVGQAVVDDVLQRGRKF
jgi:hypothetical protein